MYQAFLLSRVCGSIGGKSLLVSIGTKDNTDYCQFRALQCFLLSLSLFLYSQARPTDVTPRIANLDVSILDRNWLQNGFRDSASDQVCYTASPFLCSIL